MPFRTQRTLPPNLTPTGTRCIQITIPDDDEWERDLFSQLTELAIWQFWERDAGKNATKVARKWRKALRTFHHVDCNPIIQAALDGDLDVSTLCEILRWHNGKLQGLCCGEWVDISSDGTAPVPGEGGQPTVTSDPGAGQTMCNNVQLDALQSWLMPHPVNTGDVLEVSNLEGAWTAELTQWTYANGVPYIFGRPVGSPYLIPVDPAPTISHGKLCYVINGIYYAASDGPFTVPAGVSNAQCTLTGNLADINPSGTITFTVCLTNGATPPTATWCAYMDFRLSDFGWLPNIVGGFATIWTPGLGWQADLTASVSAYLKFNSATPFAFTYGKIRYRFQGSPSGTALSFGSPTLNFCTAIPMVNSPTTVAIDGLASQSGVTQLLIETTGAAGETELVIEAVQVEGTGFNPFSAIDCSGL